MVSKAVFQRLLIGKVAAVFAFINWEMKSLMPKVISTKISVLKTYQPIYGLQKQKHHLINQQKNQHTLVFMIMYLMLCFITVF